MTSFGDTWRKYDQLWWRGPWGLPQRISAHFGWAGALLGMGSSGGQRREQFLLALGGKQPGVASLPGFPGSPKCVSGLSFHLAANLIA